MKDMQSELLLESALMKPDRSLEYLSCDWIEGGITFIANTITACCVGFHGGGRPKLADYSGGELPIEDIIRERGKIISENLQGGFGGCAGCSHLAVKRWPERKWLFDKVLLNHFTSCNVRCVYCSFVKDKGAMVPGSKAPRLLPVFKTMVERGWLSPNSTIYFGGGEPTILPEFDELYGYLADYGTRFCIFSNGVRFSPVIETSLRAAKVDTLLLSIDAVSRNVFKAIKGVDKCDQTWENAAKYIRAGNTVAWPKIILRAENATDVIPFMEQAEKAGASRVVFDIDADYIDVPEEIIEAAALVKYECHRRGIMAITGEAGIKYRPELKAAERIDEKFKEIMQHRMDGQPAVQ